MKCLVLIVNLILWVSVQGAHLNFPKSNFTAESTWATDPNMDSPWNFNLCFFQKDEPKFPESTVFVNLWMPSMGHGSGPVELKKISDNCLEISEAYLYMKGSWEIQIQLRKLGQIFEQDSFLVKVPPYFW